MHGDMHGDMGAFMCVYTLESAVDTLVLNLNLVLVVRGSTWYSMMHRTVCVSKFSTKFSRIVCTKFSTKFSALECVHKFNLASIYRLRPIGHKR